jgi:hypothetical protein
LALWPGYITEDKLFLFQIVRVERIPMVKDTTEWGIYWDKCRKKKGRGIKGNDGGHEFNYNIL